MFEHWKSLKGVRGWYVWKLKLIDARLYFVSIFVGLLTGLIAVPYHYLSDVLPLLAELEAHAHGIRARADYSYHIPRNAPEAVENVLQAVESFLLYELNARRLAQRYQSSKSVRQGS